VRDPSGEEMGENKKVIVVKQQQQPEKNLFSANE